MIGAKRSRCPPNGSTDTSYAQRIHDRLRTLVDAHGDRHDGAAEGHRRRGGAAAGARPRRSREAGMLDAAGRVCRPHAASGARVVHATMRERPDGAGQAINCKIFAIGAKRRAELGYSPTDIGQPGRGAGRRARRAAERHRGAAHARHDPVHRHRARCRDPQPRRHDDRADGCVAQPRDHRRRPERARSTAIRWSWCATPSPACPRSTPRRCSRTRSSMIATIVTADELIAAWS